MKKKKIQNNLEVPCVNQLKKDKKVMIHLKTISKVNRILKRTVVNQNKRIDLIETEK